MFISRKNQVESYNYFMLHIIREVMFYTPEVLFDLETPSSELKRSIIMGETPVNLVKIVYAN